MPVGYNMMVSDWYHGNRSQYEIREKKAGGCILGIQHEYGNDRKGILTKIPFIPSHLNQPVKVLNPSNEIEEN